MKIDPTYKGASSGAQGEDIRFETKSKNSLTNIMNRASCMHLGINLFGRKDGDIPVEGDQSFCALHGLQDHFYSEITHRLVCEVCVEDGHYASSIADRKKETADV